VQGGIAESLLISEKLSINFAEHAASIDDASSDKNRVPSWREDLQICD
jgi:hypothetical protein